MATPTKKHESFHKHKETDIFFTNSSDAYQKKSVSNFYKKTNIFNINDDNKYNHQEPKTNPYHKKTDIFFSAMSKVVSSQFSESDHKYYKESGNKNFNPHFKESTAFERKLKEFWPEVEEKNKMKSDLGAFNKETFEESNRRRGELANPDLSAKERKILSNNNYMTARDVKNMTSGNSNSGNKASVESYMGGRNYNPEKDTKSNKVEFLKSNIFNDPEKTEIYQKFENFKIEDAPVIKEEHKSTVPFNPWNAKLDWKDGKNEILFNKDYEGEIPEDSSALKRKIQNLQDHFDGPTNKKTCDYEPDTKDHVQEKIISDKEEILRSFKANIKEDNLIRKNMELSSISQGSEFYTTNSKLYSKLDRPVRKFEVNEIKDFENLKVKEIENMFRNKG